MKTKVALLPDKGASKTRKSKRKDTALREQLFIDAYMVDRNAAQAAITAGYSAKTARQIGSKLLTRVDVQQEVTRRMEAYAATAGLAVVDVLERLKAIAFTDIRKILTDEGGMKPVSEWPADFVLAGMDIDELWGPKDDGKGKEQKGWTKKIRVWEQTPALKLLLEHLKGHHHTAPENVTNVTNNVLVQADSLMMALTTPLKVSEERA